MTMNNDQKKMTVKQKERKLQELIPMVNTFLLENNLNLQLHDLEIRSVKKGGCDEGYEKRMQKQPDNTWKSICVPIVPKG